MNPTEIGRAAEKHALDWVLSQDSRWRCIDRNFRARGGEIDLIFEAPSSRSPGVLMLVFVEVRWRGGSGFSALDSIGRCKRVRIERAARAYLLKYSGAASDIQFAVLTWEKTPAGRLSLLWMPWAW